LRRTLLLPIALASAGLGLVVAGAAVFVRDEPAVPADAGSVPDAAPRVAALSLPAPNVDGGAGPTARPWTTAQGSTPRPPVAPVAVRLPGSGLTATVVPVSTRGSGRLDPPVRVSHVGWWRGGAALGSDAGTMVLVGHVDSADQGLGAFAGLRGARPGQTVRVRGADGRDVPYRVTGLRTYSRERRLPADVFAADVAPRLVLITCTGDFDRRTAHYSRTLVVYAVPT
jgi:hypothetical protein